MYFCWNALYRNFHGRMGGGLGLYNPKTCVFLLSGFWEERGEGVKTSAFRRVFHCWFLKMLLKCAQPRVGAHDFGKEAGTAWAQISRSGPWETGAPFTCDLDLLPSTQAPLLSPLCSFLEALGTMSWQGLTAGKCLYLPVLQPSNGM